MSGVRTYRYRVKDKHAPGLARMARAVNFVWNFCNETQRTAVRRGNRWPSAYDLMHLTAGTSVALGLNAQTIEAVCSQYVRSRNQTGHKSLRWRGRESLGWVPVRAQSFGVRGLKFSGTEFSAWVDRPIPERAAIRDGSSFGCDARGRWYVNIVAEVQARRPTVVDRPVGVDLGLKTLVTLSTGECLVAPQRLRATVDRLAVAQRARKKRLTRTIHAKVKHQRAETLHAISGDLVRRFNGIFVGNVSAARLAKTRMAKSVMDAGWSSLRWMLQYKSDYAGSTYREVDERWSTRICSECGVLGGPQGREGLRVREWVCQQCGSIHDRDVNAARNILRLACQSPQGARA